MKYKIRKNWNGLNACICIYVIITNSSLHSFRAFIERYDVENLAEPNLVSILINSPRF